MNRIPGRICVVLLMAASVVAGCKDDAGGNAKERFTTLVIPAGTTIVASLGTGLSTGSNQSGDPFVATTVEPIVIDGKTVVAAGAEISGTLHDVQASGRVSGRARMTLGFHEIVDSAGTAHAISARSLTIQAASETHDDVEKIAAGGVAGAIIGGLAGGGKGAAIGAGAGAGAGTILMLATQGDEVELEAGQRLNVEMTSPASIQVQAQR